MRHALVCTVWTTVAAISGGCHGAVSKKTEVPKAQLGVVQDATREELVDKYNIIANGVKSLDATVQLKPTAGSQYSGVIEEYHEVKAFLLAQRPANIRMIGQAPVIGKTIFDMVSDGQTFRVSIPSKNKFLVGEVAKERNSKKPIENLRPQHLLDALLWTEIRKEESVLLEEFNDENARYYVLTVLRGGYRTEILRKIWFDRANLEITRLQYFGPKGLLLSDAHYGDWQVVGTAAGPAGEHISTVEAFPHSIVIERPHDDYRLELHVTKLALNADLPAGRFNLEQPPESELVKVGEEAREKQP